MKITEKIEKLFGNINMSWKTVLLMSLAVGTFCGIFGGMPALKDSSFNDMAGGYEWWVITAVIITVNCTKPLEAGFKCFIYFLITQPLAFFLQAALYNHNFSNALYYTFLWMPVIIATLPGGAIAYYSKMKNDFGAIILGIGNGIEALMFYSYYNAFTENPPRHLLSTLFALASIFIMTLSLHKNKRQRIIALIVPVLLAGGFIVYAMINGLSV